MEHSVDGDVAVIARGVALPNVCALTGETAAGRVKCLFHWRESIFHASGGPMGTILKGIRFYFTKVPKALLDVPVSASVIRKRRIAWALASVAGLLSLVTVAALLLGQQHIDGLPKGPERTSLDTSFIPAIAICGFLLVAATALVANRLMPTLTTRLRPTRISETHVWLTGAAPPFLDAIDEGRRRTPSSQR